MFTVGQKVKIVSMERGVIEGVYVGPFIMDMHELVDNRGVKHAAYIATGVKSFGMFEA